MPFVIEQTGTPTTGTDEVSYLNVILDLYPTSSTSTARKLRARLYVDNVEIGVPKSITYSESDRDVAGTLNVEIAKLADRSLFVRDASIKCTIEEYLSGSWGVIQTLVDGGLLTSTNFNLAQNTGPNDSLSIVVTPTLFQRLETTPLGTVVLYDPAKTDVSDEDLINIPDIDGVEQGVTVTPIADLSVYSVMDYVADACGFAGYQTNIPDWELRRVDFPPGEPYWNTLAGIIGNHEPILDIDADDKLVIRDGTADVQPDTVAAKDLTVDYITSLGLSTDIPRFKGTLLTYQDTDGWDYWTIEQELQNQWFGGTPGQYPLTEVNTWVQKFYRNSFPNTPVKTRTIAEWRKEYASAFVLTAASAESYSYLAGRIWKQESREWGLMNAPQSWITYNAGLPGPTGSYIPSIDGSESLYTSASDTTFSEAVVLTRSGRILYSYYPVPGVADTYYVGQTDTETRGLIMRDSENQQLGSDFDQPLTRALESGNVASGQGSYWGTTDYGRESQVTDRRRNVTIHTRNQTPLNASGLVYDNHKDRRIGDVGQSEIAPVSRQVYVTDEADADATRVEQLNGGEAPLSVLKPLCIRRNRRQFYGGNVKIGLSGIDTSLIKGRIIRPKDRSGTSFGVFMITGRTFSKTGDKEPFRTEIIAKQVG